MQYIPVIQFLNLIQNFFSIALEKGIYYVKYCTVLAHAVQENVPQLRAKLLKLQKNCLYSI